ncbi:MAG: class I SAM-dependent methyltransferase, partial [Duncaniella sp.]|nr:class I SAM-dependent methyltransferase [Duncaniella sp.]
GGGFPGIRLEFRGPSCLSHPSSGSGSKFTAAQEIATAIGLENVTFQHGDSGECHQKFDFVVSRAVMQLDELVKISARLID